MRFRRDLLTLLRLNATYFFLAMVDWVDDVRLGVSTSAGWRGSMKIHRLGPLAGDADWARPYETTPYATLRRFLRALPRDLSGYTFVDFGSGKGRVVIMAAKSGFCQAIGVEFAARLHEIAQQNIRAAGVTEQAKAIHQDARAFEIPREPCVLYFFNPFGRPVMEIVARNIANSFQECPRHIVLAFLNPTARSAFAQYPAFRPTKSIPPSWIAGLGNGRYPIEMMEARP